ncbi:hypothetical protein FKP32DRAFT_1682206 [Trametes sanguinea]|nr:hypothetical protein FKP32DRAFT_1682206 [Trametes sanguinea]
MSASQSQSNNSNLDISGVAGFFGGDASVSAMATVHIYEGRKWLGWYNQPGSYEIARRYGQLSKSRFWDALYPGVNVDPATLFGFDGTQGPKYTGVHSGTNMAKTGHVARLFMEACKAVSPHEVPTTGQRITKPGYVTVVHLPDVPDETLYPRQRRDMGSVLAVVPILGSIAACVLCAKWDDWYCFSMILLGMIASGLSCYVIGMGTLTFTHPKPASEAPPGDGLLDGEEGLVVVKGPEGAVNSITRGRFALQYTSEPRYHNIGLCSMLLTIQFLAQLLVVPQGTLNGQIAFLGSLACSWAYSSFLSSIDREDIQRTMLTDEVLHVGKEQLLKFELGTRTSMVIFTLLLLAPAETRALRRVFDDLLPNDTAEWNQFKKEIAEASLLETLHEDAIAAAEMYGRYRRGSLNSLGAIDSTDGLLPK